MARSRPAWSGVALLALVALFGSLGTAVGQGRRQTAPAVPDFDTRTRQAAGRAPVPPSVRAAVNRLEAETRRSLHVRFHPLSGAVASLVADRALTPASAGTPAEIALNFLQANGDLFGLDRDEVAGLVKVREYSSLNDTATHVTFQQMIDGIEVFEGLVTVHIARDGSVAWVTNATSPGARGPGRPQLGADEAVRAAAADVQAPLTGTLIPRVAPTGPAQAVTFDASPLARPVAVKLVYFPVRNGARLAWRVSLEAEPGARAYVVVIDAATGATLYRRNTYHDTDGFGRVFQSDTTAARDPRQPDEHPSGDSPSGPTDPPSGCPPLASYELRSLNVPFRDPATVLANTGHLEGNNVTVFRQQKNVWGAVGAFSKGNWYFDFPFDTADSVETAIFFSLNFAHDFFYDLGFDEAAGNFQADNFHRGGLGGDPLIALARSPGRNNANIEVTPEGQSPTMNLFLWDGQGCWAADVDGDGTPDLDGGYDSDVIVHEYHHGVSIRLNPAWSGDEAGAIGEGGGDFFAYSVRGNTDLAEYSYPPSGIRHVNDKTYADWYCLFGLICEVHDNGEIWANVLWDLRERFRADLVGGSEDAAVEATHQIYIDGLKLSAPAPTMLDMRDAMLEADLLRNPSGDVGGSANYCRMWQAFAGRGMGAHALDTKDTLSSDVVADYSTPAGCPGPVVATIVATAPTANEAGPVHGTFTVTRTGDTTTPLTVSYTVSGDATPDADYQALPGTVTIPAGSSDATIDVAPIDDTLYEQGESVIVTLTIGPGYTVVSPSSAAVTILSDDLAPDLAVSSLTGPSGGAAGGTVVVTDTTINRGQGPADPTVTRFLLSTNLVVDGGDAVIGARNVGALAAGASSTGTTSVTIPADVAPGVYYVLANADADNTVGESVEGNNLAWLTFKVGPDLVVSSLSAPLSSGAGDTISITDTTANQGGGFADASLTRFYLSSNTVLDATDRPLGSGRAVPGLDAGAGSTATTSLTLPSDVTAGQYYVLAVADAGDAVAESSETNNTRYTPLRVGADLIVSQLTAPSTAGAGVPILITDTIANIAGGTAAPTVTRFYLSTDYAFDSTDVQLDGWRNVPSIPGGASNSGTTTVHLPSSLTSGRYYVLAVADADAAVAELVENNNLRYTPVTIGGDLIVSAMTVPTGAGAGGTLTVTDTTMNRGTGGVPASTTRFYLSPDWAWSADDVLLAGGRSVPALGGGQSSTGTATISLPSDIPTGTYYLIARADADEVVDESDETNNTTFRSISVGPDLVVTALTAPSKAGAGASLVVSDTTKNQGGGTAGASTTRFYLSIDGVIDASDVLLSGSRSVPALGSGASSSGSTTLVLPSGIAPRAYFLIAVADGGQAVQETSETNNTRYAYLYVGPDLVVTYLSVPATAPTSGPLYVTDTTANQGGGAAGTSATRFYLSSNAVLDGGDVLLAGARAVGALAAGASQTGLTSLTLPTGLAAGTYYVIARADGNDQVEETNELNNTMARSIAIGPDLVIYSLIAPSKAGAGQPLALTDTTKNQGGSDAGPSVTRFYLSIDARIDPTDVLLPAERVVPALAAGASSSGTTTIVIPADAQVRAYFIIASADDGQSVPETNETNNARYAYVWVGPDLTVTNVSAPSSAPAGSAIVVSDTTFNQGGGEAGPSAVRYYLSTNAILDAADTPLEGARVLGAVAAGASNSGSASVVIPASVAPGTYYLIAKADADDQVTETIETNNIRFRSIQISGS